MKKRIIELIECYIAQFGFDLVMDGHNYINLGTVLKLKEIENE